MHRERRPLSLRARRFMSGFRRLGGLGLCMLVHGASSFVSVLGGVNQRPTVEGCTPRCLAIRLFDHPSTFRNCAASAPPVECQEVP